MKRKLSFLLFILLMVGSIAYGQEDKFKAFYLYNFTRYIEWPNETSQGDFKIGVVGDENFRNIADGVLSTKTVGSKPIVVKKCNLQDEIKDCHIVYIPESQKSKINEILAAIAGENILVITEAGNMTQKGSAINFIVKNGKLAFEIKKDNISKYGLSLDSRLLDLGIEVI